MNERKFVFEFVTKDEPTRCRCCGQPLLPTRSSGTGVPVTLYVQPPSPLR
jgi:hypothetical protein